MEVNVINLCSRFVGFKLSAELRSPVASNRIRCTIRSPSNEVFKRLLG